MKTLKLDCILQGAGYEQHFHAPKHKCFDLGAVKNDKK